MAQPGDCAGRCVRMPLKRSEQPASNGAAGRTTACRRLPEIKDDTFAACLTACRARHDRRPLRS